MTTTKSPQPLLRLAGIPTTTLPPPSAPSIALTPFLTALLTEALPFIDSAAPRQAANPPTAAAQHGWRAKGQKNLRPTVDAPVELSERVVNLPGTTTTTITRDNVEVKHGKIPTETWACRRSVHADAARRGSASWGEFVDALRERHVETEEAFTPAVVGSWVAAVFEGAGGVGEIEVGGMVWGGVRAQLVEMKHRMPAPLKPRVFVVLQVTTTLASNSGDEFAVVSVPITGDETQLKDLGCKLSLEKGVVQGAYVAVERVRKMKKAEESSDDGEIEWVMATASDARGVLPLWVQTKAVLGVVAKDVSLFLGWRAWERGQEARAAEEAAAKGKAGKAGAGAENGKGKEEEGNGEAESAPGVAT